MFWLVEMADTTKWVMNESAGYQQMVRMSLRCFRWGEREREWGIPDGTANYPPMGKSRRVDC